MRRLAKNITHRRHKEKVNAAQPRITCRLILGRPSRREYCKGRFGCRTVAEASKTSFQGTLWDALDRLRSRAKHRLNGGWRKDFVGNGRATCDLKCCVVNGTMRIRAASRPLSLACSARCVRNAMIALLDSAMRATKCVFVSLSHLRPGRALFEPQTIVGFVMDLGHFLEYD